jgi:hypothetical protein
VTLSWTGLVLALGYLPLATYVVQDEVRHSHGGFINLRGFGTRIVTAPSQLTLGPLLRRAGVQPVNWSTPSRAGLAELAAHVLVTAACCYTIGHGVEALVRWLL